MLADLARLDEKVKDVLEIGSGNILKLNHILPISQDEARVRDGLYSLVPFRRINCTPGH